MGSWRTPCGPLGKLLRKEKRDASRLQGSIFVFFFFLFRITAVEIRTTPSTPSKSPLGFILSNWDKFDPKSLKRKRLVFFCNTVWPQYKLGDREIRPENGSRNYTTILRLDLFHQREGKWSEIPYVQVFMALYRDPSFCSINTLTEPTGPNVDQLEDSLLSSPPVSQRRLRGLEFRSLCLYLRGISLSTTLCYRQPKATSWGKSLPSRTD